MGASMNRRGFLGLLTAASAGAAAVQCGMIGRMHQSPRLPNVVIVFTDDQGYGDLGCYGAKGFATPNVDRLAREGVRFTDFHVAQAVCSASRTALLTGCYPNRVGILGALGPNATHGINDNETTLAEVAKQRGYATAIFGKWHLGHLPQFLPTRHGFDEYFGLPYSNDMWPQHPSSKFPDLPLIEGEKIVEYNPDQSQLTTWYTQRAVRFIETNRERPFLLYVAHNMPHVPLHVSDKFKGKTERGLYGDVIEELDWSVGEILATLKRFDLEDDTFVVFMTDNGPWLSYGEHAGSAGPLREGKGTTWEGGHRVPCVMRWPGRIPKGAVRRETAMTIDLLPTIAGLIGAPLPALPIDGKDIWPIIAGEAGAKSPHEAYYFYWGNGLEAVRGGKWKVHFPHDYRSLAGKSGGMGGNPAPYKNVKTELALYDLDDDVGETHNVAAEHPEEVERLSRLGKEFDAELQRTKREPGRVVEEKG
jgi:arylsulfatase A-like enzyme